MFVLSCVPGLDVWPNFCFFFLPNSIYLWMRIGERTVTFFWSWYEHLVNLVTGHLNGVMDNNNLWNSFFGKEWQYYGFWYDQRVIWKTCIFFLSKRRRKCVSIKISRECWSWAEMFNLVECLLNNVMFEGWWEEAWE